MKRQSFLEWAGRCLLILGLFVVPLLITLFWVEGEIFPVPPVNEGPIADYDLVGMFVFFYVSFILPALLGWVVQLTVLWWAMPFTAKIPARLTVVLSTLILPLLLALYLIVVGTSIEPLFITWMAIPIGLAILIYGLLMPLPPTRMDFPRFRRHAV